MRRRGFRTKAEAQAALNDVLADVQHGSFVAPQRLTCRSYLTEWLDGLEARGRRPSTVADYRKKVRTYVLPTLGDVRLQELTPRHCDALWTELANNGRARGEGGLSARTVRYVATILGRALSDAERSSLIQRNPVKLSTPPAASAAQAPEMKVWEPGQLATFLQHAETEYLGSMLHLIAVTGLRRGEAVALQWSDVEIDAGTLTVRRNATTADNRTVLGLPNSKRSRRTLALDNETLRMLRDHRRGQAEQRLAIGPGWTDEGLVFSDVDGRMLRPERVTRTFDRLVASSGLPRIRLHDLRHGHATYLLASGANPRLVAERLGHASVAFTLDTYGHVLPNQQADAAEAVRRLIK